MISEDKMSEPDHGSHVWVKDIQADTRVSGFYVAKTKRLGLTKKGDPFLSITLSDRTGDVESRVWENAEAFSSCFNEGDILDIQGYASSYRNQIQLTLTDLKVSKDELDPYLFLETAPHDIRAMMRSLRAILKEIRDPHLRTLVETFLSDRVFLDGFKKAPAAKNFHHGYIGGLLEHTLSVCKLAKSVADHYPQLDKDLMITGAFLHDIGKIKEFRSHTTIEYTDEGRLLGHLALGIAMLDEKMERVKRFPIDMALRLKHLILSHHGQYEFGSPKRPKFLEAFALHFIDDIDAKINGLGRFMEQDKQAGTWTDFNRMFERYLLKGRIPPMEEVPSSATSMDDKQTVLFKP